MIQASRIPSKVVLQPEASEAWAAAPRGHGRPLLPELCVNWDNLHETCLHLQAHQETSQLDMRAISLAPVQGFSPAKAGRARLLHPAALLQHFRRRIAGIIKVQPG